MLGMSILWIDLKADDTLEQEQEASVMSVEDLVKREQERQVMDEKIGIVRKVSLQHLSLYLVRRIPTDCSCCVGGTPMVEILRRCARHRTWRHRHHRRDRCHGVAAQELNCHRRFSWQTRD